MLRWEGISPGSDPMGIPLSCPGQQNRRDVASSPVCSSEMHTAEKKCELVSARAASSAQKYEPRYKSRVIKESKTIKIVISSPRTSGFMCLQVKDALKRLSDKTLQQVCLYQATRLPRALLAFQLSVLSWTLVLSFSQIIRSRFCVILAR